MKLFLMCAVISIVSCIQQEPYKVQPQKLQAMIEKYGKPCAEKNNLDASKLIEQVADASIPRDDASNEFLYCFAFTAGYIKEDGHINVDILAGILGDHPLLEKMKESLRKCNEINKENHIQTTIAMNICIAETAPVRFVFTL